MRRLCVILVGLALAFWPIGAAAQQASAQSPRIGYLTIAPISGNPSPERAAFMQGLREFGYIECETIRVEYRSAPAELLLMSLRFNEAEVAAPALGLSLMPLPIRELDDFERAFEAMTRDRPDGVFVVTDALTRLREGALFEFFRANRLPSIFEFPPSARDGALMSYGPSLDELAPRAAAFVDKILKGIKPGELPLERPMRWQLIVNLKTARVIGVTIPPSI
jgi:ABC transporter substrate binding protein